MTFNIKPSWSTGVTSASDYINFLFKALSSMKPVGQIVGPPQHSTQAFIN